MIQTLKKCQDHIVCSYGYKLTCVYDRYGKPYKTYFGENAIEKLLNNMIKEKEYWFKVIETELNTHDWILLAEKDHEDFKSSTKCWICKKVYEEGEVKVKTHDNVSGKYWGLTHQECNLNLSLRKKIHVMFRNLIDCNSNLIFREVRKWNFKLIVIPKK